MNVHVVSFYYRNNMNAIKKLQLISFLLLTCIHCKPTNTNKTLTTLENTRWKLSEMNGNPIITPEGAKEVHFILTANGDARKINGFAGCNSITGSYTLTGDHIKFIVASTKMMCPAEQMEIEDFFTNVLTTADSYKIDGDVLELYEGNTSLADFKRSNVK